MKKNRQKNSEKFKSCLLGFHAKVNYNLPSVIAANRWNYIWRFLRFELKEIYTQ